MKDIDEILHNIADHTETLLRLINQPGLDDAFSQRMLDHIGLEEDENSRWLEELHSASPSTLTQKLLDHSFFIKKMINDHSIPLDLKQELLDHFGEEHREWQAERAVKGGPTVADAKRAGENRSRKGGVGAPRAARYLTDYMHSVRSEGEKPGEKEAKGALENTPAPGKSKRNPEGRQERSWTVGPMWPQGG